MKGAFLKRRQPGASLQERVHWRSTQQEQDQALVPWQLGEAKSMDNQWITFWTPLSEAVKSCKELIRWWCRKTGRPPSKCAKASLPCTELWVCAGSPFTNNMNELNYWTSICIYVLELGLMQRWLNFKTGHYLFNILLLDKKGLVSTLYCCLATNTFMELGRQNFSLYIYTYSNKSEWFKFSMMKNNWFI